MILVFISLAWVNLTVSSDYPLHIYNVRRAFQFPNRLDQNNWLFHFMDIQITMLKGIHESGLSLDHLFRYDGISPTGTI